MLNNLAMDMRKDRAKFATNVEYIKETAIADEVDMRTEAAESEYFSETVEDLEEAASWADRMDISEEGKVEVEEVSRVLAATDDLTFEEMVGSN